MICTGQQPNFDVFLFGPTIQFDIHGNQIPLYQQRYIWIPHIIEKLHRVVNPLLLIPSSLHNNALQDVISGIQQLSGNNVYSGVFLLGKVHILAHIFCHVSYRLLVNNCSIVEVLIFPTAVVDLACHLLSDQLIYISHAILHHAHLHAS